MLQVVQIVPGHDAPVVLVAVHGAAQAVHQAVDRLGGVQGDLGPVEDRVSLPVIHLGPVHQNKVAQEGQFLQKVGHAPEKPPRGDNHLAARSGGTLQGGAAARGEMLFLVEQGAVQVGEN